MKLIFTIALSALAATVATAQDGWIRIGHRCTLVRGAWVADSVRDFGFAFLMSQEGDRQALAEMRRKNQVVWTSRACTVIPEYVYPDLDMVVIRRPGHAQAYYTARESLRAP